MERRTLLQRLGTTGLLSATAGCTELTTGEDEEETSPFDERHDENPIPGKGMVDGITSINADTLDIRFSDVVWPREVTLDLYAQYSSRDNPIVGREVEPVYLTKYGEPTDYRPVLKFNEKDRVQVDSITYDLVKENNDRRFDEEYIPEAENLTLTFSNIDLPSSTPIQYYCTLREHTRSEPDTTPERHLGTTQQVLRLADSEKFITYCPTERKVGRAQPETEYSLPHFEFTEEDGDYHVHVIHSTNYTHYHTPNTDPTLDPRPDDEFGSRDSFLGYERGSYERLWELNYTVTQDEFEYAREHNAVDYLHGELRGERDNIKRIAAKYVDEDNGLYGGVGQTEKTLAPIRRVAEKLATIAELIGCETPEEKVRLVADFVQWIPYKKDIVRSGLQVQHPVSVLAQGAGDCEDKMLTLGSILYQDPFPNYEMDMLFFRHQGRNVPNHILLAIKRDIFEADVPSIETTNLSNDYYDDIDELSYAPIEGTFPAPLGKVSDREKNVTPVFYKLPYPEYSDS